MKVDCSTFKEKFCCCFQNLLCCRKPKKKVIVHFHRVQHAQQRAIQAAYLNNFPQANAPQPQPHSLHNRVRSTDMVDMRDMFRWQPTFS